MIYLLTNKYVWADFVNGFLEEIIYPDNLSNQIKWF